MRFLLFLLWGLSAGGNAIADDYDRFGSLDDPFGYEALKALITRERIQSPDELLGYFARHPQTHGDFLRQFVLLYASESRQRSEVSWEFPRILTHSGRLVLGMTGKPCPDGVPCRHFRQIEIIELAGRPAEFRFHAIDFARKGAERFIDAPKGCVDCHGASPRPIWRNYPLWPGVYGGNDDTLASSESRELENWKRFYTGEARTRGRYRHFRFGEELNYDTARPRYDLDTYRRYVPGTPLVGRSALRLNSHLGAMNRRRIVEGLTGAPGWESLQFAILAAAIDCPDIEKFVPPALARNFSERAGRDSRQMATEIRQRTKEHLAEAQARFRLLSGSEIDARHAVDLAKLRSEGGPHFDDSIHVRIFSKLRYLLEGSADQGFPRPDSWGLDYDPASTTRSYVLDSMAHNLAYLTLDLRPKVAGDPAYGKPPIGFPLLSASNAPYPHCDWLEKLSHAALIENPRR